MTKQDIRAIRLQAEILRGQCTILEAAAEHSTTERTRIESCIRVLGSVARVIEAFTATQEHQYAVTPFEYPEAPQALDDRETATILAALRYWQREGCMSAGPEQDIAPDDPMTEAEIDDLCERLNFSDVGAKPPRYDQPAAPTQAERDAAAKRLAEAIDMPASTTLAGTPRLADPAPVYNETGREAKAPKLTIWEHH